MKINNINDFFEKFYILDNRIYTSEINIDDFLKTIGYNKMESSSAVIYKHIKSLVNKIEIICSRFTYTFKDNHILEFNYEKINNVLFDIVKIKTRGFNDVVLTYQQANSAYPSSKFEKFSMSTSLPEYPLNVYKGYSWDNFKKNLLGRRANG